MLCYGRAQISVPCGLLLRNIYFYSYSYDRDGVKIELFNYLSGLGAARVR